MGMPRQKPHRSRQDYGTPLELVAACTQRFGILTWDAAATADNTLVPERFFSKTGLSAFDADWQRAFVRSDLVWLNPEFGGIATDWAPLVSRWTRKLPWLRVLMLTPASIGSEWFQQYVHRKAMVLGLSPRLHFVGAEDPYPKDCMLSCFGFGVTGFDVWRWDEDVPEPLAPGPKRARSSAKTLPEQSESAPI
jgi:hypothetical protein